MNWREDMIDSEVCNGIVERVARFGTFVQVGGESHFVHMWQQSWVWPYRNKWHLKPGDSCSLCVGRINWEGTIKKLGSFRVLHPEWDLSNVYGTEDLLVGKVLTLYNEGVSVEFCGGPVADFDWERFTRAGVQNPGLAVGDIVRARVERNLLSGGIFLVPA